MIIHSDETLKEALDYSHFWSALPKGHCINKATSEKLTSINDQLFDLGIIDDEGCFKNTVLGKRAQSLADEYFG